LRGHGSANDEKDTGRSVIPVGIINRAQRSGVAKFLMLHPAAHSDNRMRLLLREDGVVGDSPAEGATVRPVTPGKVLIHHADALVAVVVSRLEQATLPARHTHGLPI